MIGPALLVILAAFGGGPVTPPAEIGRLVDSELAAAVADCEALPPGLQNGARYLSLANVDPEAVDAVVAAVNSTLNHVSRSATISRAVPVPGSNLLRWHVGAFAADASGLADFLAAYERMAITEPYWHVTTQAIPPAADKKAAKPEIVSTDGGWVSGPEAARLAELTGSRAALLRADWFVATSSAPPHYYALAGVPETRDEFLAGLGVDAGKLAALRANNAANLFHSGVTRKVRRVLRRQGPFGGAWETFDAAKSTPERDPFRNLGTPVFDAGEHIASKANGLHWFALFDAQGRRADSVPDVIAKDDSEPLGDGIVKPMVSCVRCHTEDGIRPFRDDMAALLASAVVLSPDPLEIERIRALFNAARLQRNAVRDREDYAEAMRAATGVSAAEAAQALAATVRRYQFELVTPAIAAAELGLADVAVFRGSSDPVLVALAAGLSVQRQQWETVFGEAASRAKAAASE